MTLLQKLKDEVQDGGRVVVVEGTGLYTGIVKFLDDGDSVQITDDVDGTVNVFSETDMFLCAVRISPAH